MQFPKPAMQVEALMQYVPLWLTRLAWGIFALWLGAVLTLALQSPEVPLLPKITPTKTVNQPMQVHGSALQLLGQPTKVTSTPVTENLSEVKKTRLNLKLIGVIQSGERGVALIQKGRETVVVLPGEDIQPGVKLLEVHANQVVIEHQGKKERLLLEGAEDTTNTHAKSTAENRANANQQTNGDAYHRLVTVANQLRKSPASISKYLRFQPLRANGKWIGVQVWPKGDAAIFRAAGFKPGDIIKEVDGKTIQQMSEQPQLWQQFQKQNQFDVVVERNGELKVLNIDLTQG
jgi:general secretion pathway protein C